MTPAADSASAPVVRIQATRAWPALELAELWDHRELVWFLIWRDIKVRYAQTLMGVGWAVVQPLVTMVVFSVIFGRLAQLPSDGLPYPIFTLAALLPWQLFSAALTSSANSVVGSAHLITKVYFPRLIVPIATVAATLVDFGIVFLLTIGLMAWYGVVPSAAVVALPLFVAFALAAAFAVGLWASALNVRYRDVRHVMPFVTQFWLFVSPVAYSTSLISSPHWRAVYALNPMAGVIDGFRWALLGTAPPSLLSMLPSVLIVALLLTGGLFFFKRIEEGFADSI